MYCHQFSGIFRKKCPDSSVINFFRSDLRRLRSIFARNISLSQNRWTLWEFQAQKKYSPKIQQFLVCLLETSRLKSCFIGSALSAVCLNFFFISDKMIRTPIQAVCFSKPPGAILSFSRKRQNTGRRASGKRSTANERRGKRSAGFTN